LTAEGEGTTGAEEQEDDLEVDEEQDDDEDFEDEDNIDVRLGRDYWGVGRGRFQ